MLDDLHSMTGGPRLSAAPAGITVCAAAVRSSLYILHSSDPLSPGPFPPQGGQGENCTRGPSLFAVHSALRTRRRRSTRAQRAPPPCALLLLPVSLVTYVSNAAPRRHP